jgi:hypothetical protein
MARHVRITFLGKGQRTRDRPGYVPATYDFGGGHVEDARMFGLALLRHLRRTLAKPVDVLLLVGTPGSDWDMPYDELKLTAEGADDHAAAFDETVALSAAASEDRTTAADVLPIERRVGHALGLECRCCVIDYGYDAREQLLRGNPPPLASVAQPATS